MKETLADLRAGKLRQIGPTIDRLTPRQRQALSKQVQRRLAEAVADGSLSPDHRWLVTALQHLAPPRAAATLIAALKPATNLKGCCGCTLNRLMRTLGVLRPVEAIPALVDVVCQVKNPIHRHLAVVCIEKILNQHDARAAVLLRDHTARLRRRLTRLRREVEATPRVAPETPWDHRPGTPNWFRSAETSVKAIGRLLERRAG